jgi:hypothetical protein
VSEVCKEFATDKEAVIKKGIKKNKARDMAIYLSGNHSGITCKELVEVISSPFLIVLKRK